MEVSHRRFHKGFFTQTGRHFMKRLAYIVLLAFAFSYSAYAQKLTLLHLNDTHSHIEPERAGSLAGHGGTLERAAYIDSVRTADGKGNVLLLHAGDFGQGSSYFTLLRGFLEVDLMNALGFDVTAIGNHEFDNGIEELTERVKKLHCPVVCANYDFSKFELGRYVKPYVVLKRGGFKIGIIGLTTDVRPVVDAKIARELEYLDPVEIANSYAEILRNEKKCDMVICLTHLGFKGEKTLMDKELVSGLRNVDLVIGGHSHTFLKEIWWQKDAGGIEVPIVQNGCWGLNMGDIKVVRAL